MSEPDLRQRFAELRDEERLAIPSFRAVAGRRRTRVQWRLAFALLLIVAGSAFLLTRSPAPGGAAAASAAEDFSAADRAAARRLSSWRAPTDALLQTPAIDLLVSLPDIPSSDLPKGLSR